MNAGQKPETLKLSITPIRSSDCLKGFTCGDPTIDRWATTKAWKFHQRGRARVFTARSDKNPSVLGFYSLSFTTENSSKISSSDRDAWKNGAPLVYIDYLAVHRTMQRQKIGTQMLVNALLRAHRVVQEVAFYGVALRSLNEKTTSLYKKYGFGIAPNEGSSPLMILPIWSVRDLFTENIQE